MATIQPVAVQANFNFSQALTSLGDKTVSLINSARVNIPHALTVLKDASLHVASVAWAALKTLVMNTSRYLSIGFTKTLSAVELTMTSVAATLGPYYPIIAVSAISLAIGAGTVYAMQNRN